MLFALSAASPAIAANAPLYPEIYVETDSSVSRDAGFQAFRERLAKATEALTSADGYRVYDSGPVLALMAEDVEFFIGRSASAQSFTFLTADDASPQNLEFASSGLLPKKQALGLAGRIWDPDEVYDPIVAQRRGMRAVGQLLWEPTVGKTPWLDGRICTASYGRLPPGAFADLIESTGIPADEWLISIGNGVFDADANGGGALRPLPKPNQLVPMSHSTRRDGGWQSILTPEGDTVHIRDWPWEPGFARFANNHLCFEKIDGAWKITAIALRIDARF